MLYGSKMTTIQEVTNSPYVVVHSIPIIVCK